MTHTSYINPRLTLTLHHCVHLQLPFHSRKPLKRICLRYSQRRWFGPCTTTRMDRHSCNNIENTPSYIRWQCTTIFTIAKSRAINIWVILLVIWFSAASSFAPEPPMENGNSTFTSPIPAHECQSSNLFPQSPHFHFQRQLLTQTHTRCHLSPQHASLSSSPQARLQPFKDSDDDCDQDQYGRN